MRRQRLAIVTFGLLAALLPHVAAAADCVGSAVTGSAFRDYNADGARDPGEPGIAGIVVTATDAGGGSVTCTTTADGSYGIDGAGAFPLRIEFTLPADGSLGFLRPGPAGADSHTTVAFVAAPGAGVDVGFHNPAEYCGAAVAPDLVTACYAYGEQNDNPDGVNKDAPVLLQFPYGAGSTDLADEGAVAAPAPAAAAAAKELGSVWGLAWNPRAQTLYAAAFLKRHAGFGPSGPGAIYQLTPGGGGLFHNFGPLAGADPHPQPGQTCLSPGHNPDNTNANCWLHDANAFDLVGKVGFGDLDVDESFAMLYAVNLAGSTLLAIPLADPAAYTATAIPVPANCPAVDVHPFGLGVQDGVVYVGAVCTAESTRNRSNLRAYVYAYTPGAGGAAGTFAAAPVLEFALTYNRGAANRQWQYWLNRTTFNRNDPLQSTGRWAQPWLTDIAFDRGAMILALRDRNGDLFGAAAGGPDPADPVNYTVVAQGDLLRACPAPGGGWILEANGACGGAATAGAGNGQGPGGGEFYYQDLQANPVREETSWAACCRLPAAPR